MSNGVINNLPTSKDNRRFRRYGVRFPCTVKTKEGRKQRPGPELTVATEDVSRGGFFFITATALKVGTEIECTLQLPIKSLGKEPVTIRCRGEIARIIPMEGGKVGIGATIDSFEFVNSAKRMEGGEVPKFSRTSSVTIVPLSQ